MDAISLLVDEHDSMKRLLGELEGTTERALKTRTEVFARLRDSLQVHETIEEEIFYPALKTHPKARDIVLEGIEEHHLVDTIVAEIGQVPVDDETWGAKFAVMKENVEHHMEEEEDDMFKKARAIFDDDELEELGQRMQQRREDLKAG